MVMQMKTKRVDEILKEFPSKRILVIGDIVLDHYVSGKVDRLNPEAPVPILHAKREWNETGGAGNVAKNAAKLGAKTTLISVVGDDSDAVQLKQAAETENYQAILISDPSRPTIRKTRFMVNNQQMLRVDTEETHNIDGDVIGQVKTAIDAVLASGIDAIIVSDYAKGAIVAEVAQHIMKMAKGQDIPVAADVKPSRIDLFKQATFISPNIKEGHEYLGLNHLEKGGHDYQALSKALRDKFQTDVYLTLGPEGIYACTTEGECHIQQDNRIEVADTSGAGDTATVVMLLAYLAGAKPQEIGYLANAAGAAVVSKIGAVGISRDELRSVLISKRSHSKILSLDDAKQLAKKLRQAGKKIVSTNGSFDLLHAGHLDQFEQAKEQGDVVFVGLNTDEAINKEKSANRPLLPLEARAAMVAALTSVDYVVIMPGDYQEEPMKSLLPAIKPHIHVNGPDRGDPATWIEWPVMQKLGIAGYMVQRRNNFSTSDLIKKIKSSD